MKEDWGEAAWTARDLAPKPRPRWHLWLVQGAACALIVVTLFVPLYYVATKDAPYDPPTTPVVHKEKSMTQPVIIPPICREPVPDEPLYDAFPLCP